MGAGGQDAGCPSRATSRASEASIRAASNGVSRITSAVARMSSGHPVGSGDPDGEPVDPAGITRRPEHGERVRVAAVIPKANDRRRFKLREQPFHRLSLAACGARTEVHHETAPVMRQVVARQLAIDRLDRRHDGGPGGHTILGLANVERDRRPLRLDEQPRRAPEDFGHACRQVRRRFQRRFVAGLECDGQPFGPAAAGIAAVLEPVIAQVLDPAHANPRRDIGDRPTGENGDGQPIRSRCGEPGQAAQRDARERDDPRRSRVARSFGQGAVEVGHHEQTARSSHERGQPRDRPVGGCDGQGRTSTPGRMVCSPKP